MKILDQQWLLSVRHQLEQLEVEALLVLLYKTVQHDLKDAPEKEGTRLSIGQTRFNDGRLEWDVTVFSQHGYVSRWSSSLKSSLVDLILHYQVVEWGNNG